MVMFFLRLLALAVSSNTACSQGQCTGSSLLQHSFASGRLEAQGGMRSDDAVIDKDQLWNKCKFSGLALPPDRKALPKKRVSRSKCPSNKSSQHASPPNMQVLPTCTICLQLFWGYMGCRLGLGTSDHKLDTRRFTQRW